MKNRNMNKQDVQVTKSALEALRRELDELVNVKRPKVVERLERARGEGDLSENSDYTNARDELEFLDGRIDEVKQVVENATIIESNGNTNEVNVGARVTVKNGVGKHVFEIVGEWEADPLKQKISHDSPLGRALVGKKVGDKVEVEAPAGKIHYQILSIE